MLNHYFIRPTTVDRIRSSWIGEAIERYVIWLEAKSYAKRNVFMRVPILLRFGQFAYHAGAKRWEELPAHVDSFVQTWLGRHGREYSERLVVPDKLAHFSVATLRTCGLFPDGARLDKLWQLVRARGNTSSHRTKLVGCQSLSPNAIQDCSSANRLLAIY